MRVRGERTNSSDLGLEALLQPLRSEGDTVESNTPFTLSLESLMERYSLFEQETAGYYLLRLFQGLYALGASAVEIKTGKNELYVLVDRFQPEAPEWLEPERLREALTRIHTWTGPMHHICAAFLSVAGAPDVELALGWRGSALIASKGGLQVFPEAEPHDNLVVRVKKPSTMLFSTTAPEHILLTSRLRFGETAVTLDKLPLQGQFPAADNSKECWYRDHSDAFHLGMVRWGTPASAEWEGDFGTDKPARQSAALVWHPDSEARSATMVLDAKLDGPGVVIPVLDGVAGKTIEVHQAPGMTLFLEASDFKTDLSGLGLIGAEQLIADYLTAYRTMLAMIRPRVDELSALWTKEYPNYYLTKGFGWLAAGGGEAALILLPATFAAWAAEATVSRTVYIFAKHSRTNSLRSGLAERIDSVLSAAQ